MSFIGDGFLSLRVQHRMAEMGLSLRAVSEQCGVSYEHIRKVYKGELLPSKYLLPLLSKVLSLGIEELKNLRVFDMMECKFGAGFWQMRGIDPRLGPIYKFWPYLSDEQKTDLLVVAESRAARNRARIKGIAHESVPRPLVRSGKDQPGSTGPTRKRAQGSGPDGSPLLRPRIPVRSTSNANTSRRTVGNKQERRGSAAR